MVFSDALFPHMTVRRNVAFGLPVRGISDAEVDLRVDEMLEIQLEYRQRHRVENLFAKLKD